MMPVIDSDKVLSTILKHDTKVTSYKIALLRAINDVVLTYPDLRTYQSDVAVPLKLLAEFWIAYYWPFVDPNDPIQQGQRAQRQGQTINDMAFRPALTELRQQWEQVIGGLKNPADGFFCDRPANTSVIPRRSLTLTKVRSHPLPKPSRHPNVCNRLFPKHSFLERKGWSADSLCPAMLSARSAKV
jgi:hypothetical protein